MQDLERRCLAIKCCSSRRWTSVRLTGYAPTQVFRDRHLQRFHQFSLPMSVDCRYVPARRLALYCLPIQKEEAAGRQIHVPVPWSRAPVLPRSKLLHGASLDHPIPIYQTYPVLLHGMALSLFVRAILESRCQRLSELCTRLQCLHTLLLSGQSSGVVLGRLGQGRLQSRCLWGLRRPRSAIRL